MNYGLSFDDVLIVPSYSELDSRDEIDLGTDLGFVHLDIPIMTSPMDSVTGIEMMDAIRRLGGIGIHHRYADIDLLVRAYHHGGIAVSPSMGLDWTNKISDEDRAYGVLVVDVAHGHTKKVIDYAAELVKQGFNVMSGNIVTAQAAEDYLDAGVNLLRVGVGGGCFAAGTRVLMADGSYKNIEKINVEDSVIDGLGNPTKVTSVRRTGVRNVVRYKNANFYDYTYCTPDHQHLCYDISGYSDATYKSGLTNLVNSNSPIWKPIFDFHKRDYAVLPNIINFALKDNFTIDLTDFSIRESFVNAESREIKNSYDLGYIFGTFLGDGNANLRDYDRENSQSSQGRVSWSFGINESGIANKLAAACKSVFARDVKISNKNNILLVTLDYQAASRFFIEFGKRQDKHLPSEYMCSDLEYLKGIFDGLVDSDGNIEEYGRVCLTNTSKNIIELFNVVCYLVKGSFPSNTFRQPRIGNLEGANIQNVNVPYSARLGTTHLAKHADFYTTVEITRNEKINFVVPVYDIEVESDHHSFIANNVVVHNSACSTRVVSGVGVPQFSAILEVASACGDDAYVIADGGIRYGGDIVKALVAGASCVMVGRLVAGATEAPGLTEMVNGRWMKMFRGMASASALDEAGKERNVEGVSAMIPYEGSVAEILDQVIRGVRAGFGYVGAKNINELWAYAQFIQVSPLSIQESHPRI